MSDSPYTANNVSTYVRPLPDGVEWTAVVVAAQRAAESLSDTPAFRDPLAEAIVSHLGLAEPGKPPNFDAMPGEMAGMTDLMGDLVPLRTLLYDKRLTAANHGQIVLLGAGLDGRAYRMPWAGRRIFELDLPGGLALKEDAARAADLPEVVERTPVPVDLAQDWTGALLAAGFDPSRPTAWVAEGLTHYLTRAESDLLMTRIRELSAPGSRLCIEILQPLGTRVTDENASDNGVRRLLSALRFGPPTPPHDWMAGHGWKPDALTIVELAEQYGRKVTEIFDLDRDGIEAWYFDSEFVPG